MKITYSFTIVGILGAMTLSAPNANALTVLDTFTTIQTVTQTDVGSNVGSVSAPGALGGHRRLVVSESSGDGGDIKARIDVTAKKLAYSSEFGNDGNVLVQYDGTAGNVFNPNGLGSINLSNELYLQGLVAGDLINGSLGLRLYSGASNFSSSTINIVGSGSSSVFLPFQINFATLTPTGSGVDLSNVTAIELRFGGSNSFDGGLRLLQFNNVPEPGNVAFAITGGMTTLGMIARRRRNRK